MNSYLDFLGHPALISNLGEGVQARQCVDQYMHIQESFPAALHSWKTWND